MNKIIQYLLFFSVFFLVYSGMHAYALRSIYQDLSLDTDVVALIVLSALALSFPAFSVIERFYSSKLTRLFYLISAIWLGVLFISFFVLLMMDFLGFFFQIEGRIQGIIALISIPLLSTYSILNARILRTRIHDINIKGLEKEFRLVHLSDLHLGSIHNSAYLKSIIEKTNSLKPDAVAITGDIFDDTSSMGKHVTELFDDIDVPMFASYGNHEHYTGEGKVNRALSSTKIMLLRDDSKILKGVQFIGIDNSESGIANGNGAIKKIDIKKNMPSVLLYHSPTGLDEARKSGIDIQLSGHTHNGQIFPFNLIVKMFYRYTRGLHDVGGMWLNVSEGTGTWGPPMRLGSKSEIVLLNLLPSARRVQG